MYMSQEQLYAEICTYKGRKARANQTCAVRFVRAGAIEMYKDTGQIYFYLEFYGENAALQSEHLDQASAATSTVRISPCGHAV